MRTLGFFCLAGYWFRKSSVIVVCIVIPRIIWFWPRGSGVRAGCPRWRCVWGIAGLREVKCVWIVAGCDVLGVCFCMAE